uniref:Putative 2'-deoxynucleoside 5'-phosphate N-hydrolase 1 n=1 Tax=Candidatus Methanogaster sp. ANME-2c ERB4 TaxID=2759911 RepID=A0A7G9YRH5_9EURY|nr:2'-deoxynucleoside 5'-phosphate N-hydrolase 1 [Methanosarcinales archaeon ANME-2c ERB4]QNO50609.1 2'-deoxynucleoside 5'-phosphate N-hydrolase 1 [Methanosarcinales archaeon ANME-2c ERB4]
MSSIRSASSTSSMKIFLAGSIRGGRQMQPVYRHIYDFLRSRGYDVMSWHVVDPGSDEKEAKMSEQEIYRRDISLLKESGCLIAEVTVPSIGVGYEICRALEVGLPVLCVHDADANVSAMLLGNPNRELWVQEYCDVSSLERILCEFVEMPDEGKD